MQTPSEAKLPPMDDEYGFWGVPKEDEGIVKTRAEFQASDLYM